MIFCMDKDGWSSQATKEVSESRLLVAILWHRFVPQTDEALSPTKVEREVQQSFKWSLPMCDYASARLSSEKRT